MATITGRLIVKLPVQAIPTRNGGEFKKQEFIIAAQRFDPDSGVPAEDTDNTPRLTATGRCLEDLERVTAGAVVRVDYTLRGRRYTDKNGIQQIITEPDVRRITEVPDVYRAPLGATRPVETAAAPMTQMAEPVHVTADPAPAYDRPHPMTAQMDAAKAAAQAPAEGKAVDDLPF